MRFSLRRSLCITLLVAVTAYVHAQWNQSQIINALQELSYISAQMASQYSNGYGTAYYLNSIRDKLSQTGILISHSGLGAADLLSSILSTVSSNLGDIKSDVSSQSTSLDSLSTSLSSISDLVQSISDSIGSETNAVDLSAIISKLDSLQTVISSYSTSVASIETLLSALSSNQVNPDDLLQSISDVSTALSSITTYTQFSSEIASLKDAISAISTRLDSTLDVSGSVEINSHDLAPLRMDVQNVRQQVEDFQTFFRLWLSGTDSQEHYSPTSWLGFVDKFDGFLLLFDSALTAIQGVYSYLTGEFREEFHDVWTNTVSYLPYLTNSINTAFYDYVSNNLVHIAFPTSDLNKYWSIMQNGGGYYPLPGYELSAYLTKLLQQFVLENGSVQQYITRLPGNSSVSTFFRDGRITLTQQERFAGGPTLADMDQRRFLYTVSNTVPYIEGLPRHRQKVGGAGDTWTGAFGDLEWSGGNPQPVSGTPNRTPWNRDYFSTDYFADLLKLLAATNLHQNADIGERLIDAVELIGSAGDDLGPDVNLTNQYVGPVFTNLSDVLKPEELFPESVDLNTPESSDLDAFDSGALEKIGYSLNMDLSPSGQILLFPAIADLGPEFEENYYYDLEQYFTPEEQQNVRRVFSVIWHIIFYIFSVHLVYSEIKAAISAS